MRLVVRGLIACALAAITLPIISSGTAFADSELRYDERLGTYFGGNTAWFSTCDADEGGVGGCYSYTYTWDVGDTIDYILWCTDDNANCPGAGRFYAQWTLDHFRMVIEDGRTGPFAPDGFSFQKHWEWAHHDGNAYVNSEWG